MTTTRKIDVTCPCCGHEFQVTQVMSTNTFGPLTTDLYQYASGFQAIEFGLDMCRSCGYAAVNMSEEKDIPDTTRQFVIEHLKTKPMGTHSQTTWISYEHSALIKEFEGEGPWEVACIYLSAAWCARIKLGGLVKSSDAEKNMRQKVVDNLKLAIDTSAVPELSICSAHYLLAENLRRVGEKEEAGKWYAKTKDLDPDMSQWRMFNTLAVQQGSNPEKYISDKLREKFSRWAMEEERLRSPEVTAEMMEEAESMNNMMDQFPGQEMSTGCMVVCTILFILCTILYTMCTDRESWGDVSQKSNIETPSVSETGAGAFLGSGDELW